MSPLEDDDLLIVGREGVNFKTTYAKLRDQIAIDLGLRSTDIEDTTNTEEESWYGPWL